MRDTQAGHESHAIISLRPPQDFVIPSPFFSWFTLLSSGIPYLFSGLESSLRVRVAAVSEPLEALLLAVNVVLPYYFTRRPLLWAVPV